MSETQADYEPKEPEEVDFLMPEWKPNQPATVLYERRFAEWAKSCGFREMCVDYHIPCHLNSCPIEQRLMR